MAWGWEFFITSIHEHVIREWGGGGGWVGDWGLPYGKAGDACLKFELRETKILDLHP